MASVTSVAGPNHGSELADHLDRTAPGDSPQGRILKAVLQGLAVLLVWLETGWRRDPLPVDLHASHQSMTTAGVALFNQAYPKGCRRPGAGKGPMKSMVCVITRGLAPCSPALPTRVATALTAAIASAPVCPQLRQRKGALRRHGRAFQFAPGQVIGDDYPLDHLDIVNQSLGAVGKGAEPVRLFTEHAARLKAAGL